MLTQPLKKAFVVNTSSVAGLMNSTENTVVFQSGIDCGCRL